MQKVTDYTLLTGGSADDLAMKVKNGMAEDWVPSGTVVAFDAQLIQAMVKFEQA